MGHDAVGRHGNGQHLQIAQLFVQQRVVRPHCQQLLNPGTDDVKDRLKVAVRQSGVAGLARRSEELGVVLL